MSPHNSDGLHYQDLLTQTISELEHQDVVVKTAENNLVDHLPRY